MQRYVVVKDGTVINIVKWDGVSAWQKPEGCEIYVADERVDIGHHCDCGIFTYKKGKASESSRRISQRERIDALEAMVKTLMAERESK